MPPAPETDPQRDNPASAPAAPPPPPWRQLRTADIPEWVRDSLFSAERTRPIVAVTTTAAGRRWVDLAELGAQVGDRAELVFIETGEATRALSAALPPLLGVFGGASRLWWPGLTPTSNPYDHRLYFARSREEGDDVVRQIAAALVAGEGSETARAAWRAIAEEFGVGDVIRGRVSGIKDFGVFVELLPGANGLVRLSELDWEFVHDPADLVELGELVDVQLLSIDVEAGRAELSLKRGWERPARPATGFRVEEGETAGDKDATAARGAPDARRASPAAGVAAASGTDRGDQLAALRSERTRLMERVRELEKELRGERDRSEQLRKRGMAADPLSSAEAFLLAVRLAYARQYGEGERRDFPLASMRVGASFLQRLAALEGLSVDKVVEVCAQVASGRAHQIRSREVHQFRAGEGGAPIRTRQHDGAKAWRCSLQDGTPSARRLHWWNIPAADGAIVEFASVGVHDDLTMPE